MTRVLHVASGDLWGGAEALLLSLARAQAARPADAVACAILNEGKLAAELQLSGIETHVVDESRLGLVAICKCLSDIVRAFRPDVIHSHREKEHLLCRLATLPSRAVKHVATFHGLPEPLLAGSGFKRRVINSINYWNLTLGFEALVGVSEDIGRTLAQRFIRHKVNVIRNGVSLSRVLSQSSHKRDSNKRLTLLALGRLVPIKRFDRLQTLKVELERLAPGRFEIVVAGDGPLREHLQNSCPDVSFVGFHSETRALIGASAGLVLTSDHEGIPMAVLEAIAAGLPAFAFRVGGLPEIAASGAPLKLVAPFDIAALAHAINDWMLKDDVAKWSLPDRWEFDIQTCANAHSQLYDRISNL